MMYCIERKRDRKTMNCSRFFNILDGYNKIAKLQTVAWQFPQAKNINNIEIRKQSMEQQTTIGKIFSADDKGNIYKVSVFKTIRYTRIKMRFVFEKCDFHFVPSFAVLMEAINILRIEPQSCKMLFAIASGMIFAFCAISIQYSVS